MGLREITPESAKLELRTARISLIVQNYESQPCHECWWVRELRRSLRPPPTPTHMCTQSRTSSHSELRWGQHVQSIGRPAARGVTPRGREIRRERERKWRDQRPKNKANRSSKVSDRTRMHAQTHLFHSGRARFKLQRGSGGPGRVAGAIIAALESSKGSVSLHSLRTKTYSRDGERAVSIVAQALER